VSVALEEHSQCTGECVWQLQWQLAAVLCLVEEFLAGLSVQENCVRNSSDLRNNPKNLQICNLWTKNFFACPPLVYGYSAVHI
jgi:hypothetical protein